MLLFNGTHKINDELVLQQQSQKLHLGELIFHLYIVLFVRNTFKCYLSRHLILTITSVIFLLLALLQSSPYS